MQPHSSQSDSTDNVGKIDNCTEKTFKTDSAGNDDGKQQCQGHDNKAANKPDSKQIPHGDAEQTSIGQFDKI